MISILKTQAKDLFAELDKVEWPGKEKVVRFTWSVVILSVFVGLYSWGADWVISWVFKFIIPTR